VAVSAHGAYQPVVKAQIDQETALRG